MDELASLGASVFAASVDPLDKAREVSAEASFPIGYAVTRDVASALGSWWEERRGIIQPSEFILGAGGKVLASSYSDGPLGRIDAADVVRWIRHREKQSQ
jgi:peroxiredoxin